MADIDTVKPLSPIWHTRPTENAAERKRRKEKPHKEKQKKDENQEPDDSDEHFDGYA